MGLDISYYRRLIPVTCDKYGDCEHVIIHHESNAEFRKRMAPLAPGCYVAIEEGEGFHAGSYGGYNAWRELLCVEALGVGPAVVWGSEKYYAAKAFYELINFSDCEGTIGPVVAKKLAADFAAFDGEAQAAFDDYGLTKYREWRKAFEMAADGGAVLFH